MDFTSIIGLVAGIILVVYGIGMDKIGNFLDTPSALIVVGGTVAAVVASFPLRILKNVPKHFKILLQGKNNPAKIIEEMVDLAQFARRNGLLALEDRANELKDPFFKQSVLLIVDAMDTEKVRELLETQVDMMSDRHEENTVLYDKAAAYSPSFGLIGTLIGLINMLKSMNMDAGGSNDMGKNMAVAMITTFYGCVLASLVFSPIAKKLRIRNEEEVLYKQLIIEGVISIQSGDNPKFLKEKLVSYLEQGQQKRILEGKDSTGKEKAAQEAMDL
ncbi:motility protein A [Parasporobacterium paucivorans]|uniref:Chemotaxis protein MotA n=1 Tax=Parasporobacterium paucivorans DSM 15970 TaxID=1122934 RepID=A0A1M6I8S0_9FIRM|nr:MotA/TolQ/ExbB proton channel family protein [Parasporobacterium paucivorans]SHJ30793.1 chemotaxis protein MotA [Parasporobacterium paucivorans DSM 15970]